MKIFSLLFRKTQKMKHKLFTYMLILVLLILLILISGLRMIGSFTGEKQEIYEILSFQNEVYGRQLDTHFDRLAAMSIHLSNDITAAVEKCLKDNAIAFSEVSGCEKNVLAVHTAVFDHLEQKLLESDCSGAFVVLEATVNGTIGDDEYSRAGLYLQRSSVDYSDNSFLLYRGPSGLGKEHGIMPHRKWRLEFAANMFPDHSDLYRRAALPLTEAYHISDIFTLAGTDERAVLLTIPIVGTDNTVYGLCGFEISENFFKHTFSQPSRLDHAAFVFNKGTQVSINGADSFSCGIKDGYYLSPSGEFVSSDFGGGLILFSSGSSSYIGTAKKVRLCKDCDFVFTSIIPRQDYSRQMWTNSLQITMLCILVLSATIGCSLLFSHKYLMPFKGMLELFKQQEYDRKTGISEADDLFTFLAEQNRLREAEFDKMRKAHDDTRASLESIQNLHDETMKQIERLAYSRKDEVDPYDYENFKAGLKTLTDREREILDLYVAGHNVKEIVDLTGVKESTVRFHNKNIYSKLGVHSLKQLLRYFEILNRTQ